MTMKMIMKMKLFTLAFLVSLSTQAQAQSSKAELPLAPEDSTNSATTANPTATSTLQTSTEQASTRSRFGLNFIVEASSGVGDLKEKGSRALIESYNATGLTYKISEKMTAELRHNFAVKAISDREQLKVEKEVSVIDPATGDVKTENQLSYEDPYQNLDPTIHLDIETPYTLWGSKPISSSNRYYIPVSNSSRESKTYGTLRSTHVVSWDLTTRWALDVLADIRFTINHPENTDGQVGSDSALRSTAGPGLTYHFNDQLSAYYLPYVDLVTTGHQRGRFADADQKNHLCQDLGVYVALGSFTINPYYSTRASADETAAYVGMGSDSTSSYNLLVQALF